MKAIVVHAHGGPAELKYEEAPEPSPAEGEIRVRVAVAGVNFIDTYQRTGLYPVQLPFIPGLEAAGTVEAVGSGVAGFQPGDRVAYAMGRASYAEVAAVPAWQAVRLPEGIDFAAGAAVMLQGMTAHYLTHSVFPLKAGETALVHAGGGGTGALIIQLARLRGARVFATTSTEEKAERARAAGADEVILYTRQDFQAETRRLTGGRGVDVVYDSVGAATWEKSLDSLRPRGLMVSFGNAGGPVPAMKPLLLAQKGSLFLTRPSLFHYCATREELLGRAADLFGWLREGKLSLHIHRRYPLAEAAQAHRDLEGRKTMGKLLLEP